LFCFFYPFFLNQPSRTTFLDDLPGLGIRCSSARIKKSTSLDWLLLSGSRNRRFPPHSTNWSFHLHFRITFPTSYAVGTSYSCRSLDAPQPLHHIGFRLYLG
jgi:hypothetical protein